MTKWALRTIRHGRVKIGGYWYYPSEQFLKYDGRLDGMRYLFGRYPDMSYVCLWGSEALWRDEKESYGPELVEGAFPWQWWDRKIEEER